MSWQKPSDQKCPKCGSYMVEKGNRLVCSDSTCGYVEKKEKINFRNSLIILKLYDNIKI